MSKTLHLISLGCTKNLVDSEVMLGRLKDYALTDNITEADVIIINTCGFIDAAKEESINTILAAHEARKEDSILVVSGCLSERYREELAKELPEVDIFTGVGDYERIDRLIATRQSTFSPEVYLATEKAERVITGSNYHAYIKIAEGCNQQCSFCAIPHFKGKLHSRTIDSIVKEVRHLVSKGFYDFSFISQDSSSFGRDIGLNDGLIALIDAVEKIEGVKSARILYLYPSTTSFALIDRIADSPLFQTYYDMPVQHIDDRILKTMKRGFGEHKTVELLERMKRKANAFIRTSVIAGHPGEDEAAFEKLCNFLDDFGFDRVNVFAYSNEESTAAYTMEQLPQEVIAARTERLGEIAAELKRRSLDRTVGRRVALAIDGESDEHAFLLAARPLMWAPEIDGDVLVNDTNEMQVRIGGLYEAEITERIGEQLLATLTRPLT